MNFKSFLSTWKAVFLGGWRGVSILTSQKSFPASWWIIILKTTIITFTPFPLAFSRTTWQASCGGTIAALTSQQSWSHSHRIAWSRCLSLCYPHFLDPVVIAALDFLLAQWINFSTALILLFTLAFSSFHIFAYPACIYFAQVQFGLSGVTEKLLVKRLLIYWAF